jgi:serine/threonine protein kinase
MFVNAHGYRVRLIDFGSAEYVRSHPKTHIISTRYYRAPEVILGIGWAHTSDLWSLGCLLMEMYLGRVFLECSFDNIHLFLIERKIMKIGREMLSNSKQVDAIFRNLEAQYVKCTAMVLSKDQF